MFLYHCVLVHKTFQYAKSVVGNSLSYRGGSRESQRVRKTPSGITKCPGFTKTTMLQLLRRYNFGTMKINSQLLGAVLSDLCFMVDLLLHLDPCQRILDLPLCRQHTYNTLVLYASVHTVYYSISLLQFQYRRLDFIYVLQDCINIQYC